MDEVAQEFKVNAATSDESRNDLKDDIGYRQREYTWSKNTHKAVKRVMKQFTNYIKEHERELYRSDLSTITRDVMGDFLKYRQNDLELSPETISNDMWALNKIFDEGLTKKEFDLKSRIADEVTNNRNPDGDKKEYEDLTDKAKRLADVSLAFGLRRNEYKGFTDKSLYMDKNGDLYNYVGVFAKGGKIRAARCTDEMKDTMLDRYGQHVQKIEDISELGMRKKDWREATKGGRNLEKATFDHDLPVHRIGRQHYAQQLLRELEEKEVKFSEDYLLKQNRTKTDLETYTTNGVTMQRTHAQFVSQNLGHNRIDVLKRYIF